MGTTYYAQSEHCAETMTVGELIRRLKMFHPDEKVIFRSPMYGSFGSNTAYAIESINRVLLGREERTTPSYKHEDEETGELITVEEYTQVWREWSGVVIG
jgi:hypothetical protein